ncbi:MAG: MBL fold metallo-hydrolase [Candidatus Sabulitectum sp.]|nr:MBL fold metallo-hydrolase [Candidatus Sabulitectum sp.]
MNISIVYDNTTNRADLTADWGWSCFIETEERNILFDTGGNGRILLDNMRKMNIDPLSVDDLVISHPDFDHIGGLSAFLNSNPDADVHVPFSFRGIKYPNKVYYHKEPVEIHKGVFLTGELGREQSLALSTPKGLAVIIGCGHPGIRNIIDTISRFGDVYAVIGGLHDFNSFKVLKDATLICSTHCTKHIKRIKKIYPEKYIEGGVGKVIELTGTEE